MKITLGWVHYAYAWRGHVFHVSVPFPWAWRHVVVPVLVPKIDRACLARS